MVASISAAELKRRLDLGEPLALLDVREPDERAFCRIAAPPTAADLHVPMDELPRRLDEIREQVHGPMVVYCHLGVRSLLAARWLSAHGLAEPINLDGGIDAWSVEVDPAVRRY